jgi:predicted O-methyltransferase YrrM
VSDDEFVVGDVRFTVTWNKGSTPDHFFIRKPVDMARTFASFVAAHQGANVVELGVAQGGGTALTLLFGRPRRLVSIEYDPHPVAGLAGLVERLGMSDRVHTYYGVDQADRPRVEDIVGRAFGDEPLDLVIDDASHLLAETTASFETLFPRLRPGGQYLIEDWAWRQQAANKFHDVLEGPPSAERAAAEEAILTALVQIRADPSDPRHADALAFTDGDTHDDPVLAPMPEHERRTGNDPGLVPMVFRLTLAHIARPDLFSEITIDEGWAKVRRGDGPIDPAAFRLDELFADHFGVLG